MLKIIHNTTPRSEQGPGPQGGTLTPPLPLTPASRPRRLHARPAAGASFRPSAPASGATSNFHEGYRVPKRAPTSTFIRATFAHLAFPTSHSPLRRMMHLGRFRRPAPSRSLSPVTHQDRTAPAARSAHVLDLHRHPRASQVPVSWEARFPPRRAVPHRDASSPLIPLRVSQHSSTQCSCAPCGAGTCACRVHFRPLRCAADRYTRKRKTSSSTCQLLMFSYPPTPLRSSTSPLLRRQTRMYRVSLPLPPAPRLVSRLAHMVRGRRPSLRILLAIPPPAFPPSCNPRSSI